MAALSLISLALGYLLTVLLHRAIGLPVDLAYALAVLTCSGVNFFGCRYWVFQGDRGPVFAEAGRFLSSVIVFRGIEIIAFSQITSALGNYHVSYFITACLAVCLKFIAFRTFVFRRGRAE